MEKRVMRSLISFLIILFPITAAYASSDMQDDSDLQSDTSPSKPSKSLSKSRSSDTSVDQMTEKLEGTSISDSSQKTWSNTFTNFYYNATFKADVEMAKFPNLSIAILLERLTAEDEHSVILGKKYEYRTGTNESASDYYSGWLHFTALDYGEAEHHYISPQEGFDPSVTLISRKSEIKPHVFIGNLVKKGVIDAHFLKGTPYKDDMSKTCIEYIIFSRAGNRYISVKAFRHLSETGQ